MLLLLFVGRVTANLSPWSFASPRLPVTSKMPSCLTLAYPHVYLLEVVVAGFHPQYLLNLNQEAYTLAHCTTAHSSIEFTSLKGFDANLHVPGHITFDQYPLSSSAIFHPVFWVEGKNGCFFLSKKKLCKIDIFVEIIYILPGDPLRLCNLQFGL